MCNHIYDKCSADVSRIHVHKVRPESIPAITIKCKRTWNIHSSGIIIWKRIKSTSVPWD